MAPPRESVGLPAFIIIGTMKGGTTSLHLYLSQHPEVCMSAAKEPNYFIEARNFGKGLDWYRSLFADHTKVCGEASPVYSKRHRHEGVPERLRDVVPHVRLIYVLRDPIDRIVSHYLHNQVIGRETRSLSAAIAARAYRNNYVRTSLYAFQLDAFLRCFSLERILIVTAENLKDRRTETLEKIFRFIGVDPDFKSSEFDRLFNQTPVAGQSPARAAMGGHRGPISSLRSVLGQAPSQRPALDPDHRNRLIEHLAPDIERLRALTGLRLERWSL